MSQLIQHTILSKTKIAGKTPDDGSTSNIKIAVQLKYLSNF